VPRLGSRGRRPKLRGGKQRAKKRVPGKVESSQFKAPTLNRHCCWKGRDLRKKRQKGRVGETTHSKRRDPFWDAGSNTGEYMLRRETWTHCPV